MRGGRDESAGRRARTSHRDQHPDGPANPMARNGTLPCRSLAGLFHALKHLDASNVASQRRRNSRPRTFVQKVRFIMNKTLTALMSIVLLLSSDIRAQEKESAAMAGANDPKTISLRRWHDSEKHIFISLTR